MKYILFIGLILFSGCSQDSTRTETLGVAFAQEKGEIIESTGTAIAPVIAPTTAQIIIDGLYLLNKEQRIAELKKALDTKPDIITGQTLLNYKTNLETEILNEKTGRKYVAQITYTIYNKINEVLIQ